MTVDTLPYTAEDLDRFRSVQRLAYECAVRVEEKLAPGMTEREVCGMLADLQREAGIEQVFHYPFAWFGERTMLGEEWTPDVEDAMQIAGLGDAATSAFFPQDEPLRDGQAVIVDLAPVRDGYSSDIGYSCIVGTDPVYDELHAGLEGLRTFLLDRVNSGDTLRTIYRDLDTLLADNGWANCHQHYPDRALGHLVFRLEPDPDHASPIPGFGTAAAEGLLVAGFTAIQDGTCYPVWNDSEFSDHPPAPGLWAVEPHIGRDGVGAKWEELLVVGDGDARWLDDDLPHHRKWRGKSPLVG